MPNGVGLADGSCLPNCSNFFVNLLAFDKDFHLTFFLLQPLISTLGWENVKAKFAVTDE